VRFWDLVQLQRLVGAGELPCLMGHLLCSAFCMHLHVLH
jgi:hypothetical protein